MLTRSQPGRRDRSSIHGRNRWYKRRGKRLLDVSLATAGLLLVAPLLVSIAVALLVTLGRPVLFQQERIGYRGVTFRILKFRTMDARRNSAGDLLPDRERVGRLGRFLRRTSLDELPELWNVLRGEMSLVGPRPQLPEYLAYMSQRQRRRHDVKPGLTGLAQVLGRNKTSFRRRFALDTLYAERVSFALDVWVLWLTARIVTQDDGGVDAAEKLETEAIRAAARGHF